jgi:hypothetical protein
MEGTSVPRTKVFVSYSHRDRDWLDRLQIHLGVLERRKLVHLWSDTRISIGEAWEAKINEALEESKVAVLLVSPDFLASDYIWKKEMSLIQDHERKGMKVFPLIVRPCAWKIETVLKQTQARPAGGRALSMGSEAQIDLALSTFVYELAERIGELPDTLLATQEQELAEGHLASSIQRTARELDVEVNRVRPTTRLNEFLMRLPNSSWTGPYHDYLKLRLKFLRTGPDSIFQGRMEYLGDDETVQKVTSVEGRFEEDYQKTAADLGRELNDSSSREAPVALSFKEETDYQAVTHGRRIRLDGEYRALAWDSLIVGAWFTNEGPLLARFELTCDE